MPRIRFRYQPLTAGEHSVGLCGDLNDWKIEPMHDVGGDYQLYLFLNPGRYRYKLIVDGAWIPDPSNPLRENDPFGGENSILLIEESGKALSWQELMDSTGLQQGRLDSASPVLLQDLIQINRITQESSEIRFKWHKGLSDKVILSIENQELPMYRIGADGSIDLFHLQIQHQESALLSVYAKVLYGTEQIYIGKTGLSLEPPLPLELDFSKYRVFSVPEWVQEGVIYQIFPDRFAIGNPENNPDFSEWYYRDSRTAPPSGEFLPPQTEYFHLIEDWRDIKGLVQSPYLPKGKPDWWSFYGGDLAGITQKLDYLVDLGITIIYLNPLWQAKSNHKYDAADYMQIDPHFGTEAELQTLANTAHAKGIRIILDVAFNHTGETFWAFRDCIKKGPFSEYWNWYDWHKYPLPEPLPADFDPKEYYQCWWGVKDMPDLNYDLSRLHPDENYVKDINHAVVNTPLVDYVLHTADYWLGQMDLDGFRLDVPDEVPYWFWELFRRHVKSVKPDAWLVGEIWNDAEDWVNDSYFDSVMNYAYFKSPSIDYLIHRAISLEEFQTRIEEGLSKYPLQAQRAMMNLYGSHDTWRIIELAKGDIQLIKMAITFQMCFVGTPHVYYGDEIAMRGKKDPDNRRPFNWNWEIREEAVELRACFKELISIRKRYPALVYGEFAFVSDPNNLCHFKRFTPEEEIHVILNPSKRKVKLYTPPESMILYQSQAASSNFISPKSGVILHRKGQYLNP